MITDCINVIISTELKCLFQSPSQRAGFTLNTLTRVSICNVATAFGGTLEWAAPWGWVTPETSLSHYAMRVATEQLEAAKVVRATRWRLRTKVTMTNAPPSAKELTDMSRLNRYHCAQIALLRDQDPQFSENVVMLDGLDVRLEKIFPGLAQAACANMLNDLRHDLIMATV